MTTRSPQFLAGILGFMVGILVLILSTNTFRHPTTDLGGSSIKLQGGESPSSEASSGDAQAERVNLNSVAVSKLAIMYSRQEDFESISSLIKDEVSFYERDSVIDSVLTRMMTTGEGFFDPQHQVPKGAPMKIEDNAAAERNVIKRIRFAESLAGLMTTGAKESDWLTSLGELRSGLRSVEASVSPTTDELLAASRKALGKDGGALETDSWLRRLLRWITSAAIPFVTAGCFGISTKLITSVAEESGKALAKNVTLIRTKGGTGVPVDQMVATSEGAVESGGTTG